MDASARLIPEVTESLAPFFAAARRGELVVQRCDDCGALRFPDREICSSCWSTAAQWVPVSGRGEIYSFYVMHQIYHPAFATEVPYAVVTVQLEEGPRLTTNVVGTPPSDLRIGQKVEAVFDDVLSDEVTLPKFRLVAG